MLHNPVLPLVLSASLLAACEPVPTAPLPERPAILQERQSAAYYRAKYQWVGDAHRAAMSDLIATFKTMPSTANIPSQAREAAAYGICLKHIRRLNEDASACDIIKKFKEVSIPLAALNSEVDTTFSESFYFYTSMLDAAMEDATSYNTYKAAVYDIQDLALVDLEDWELEPFFEITSADLSSAQQWYSTTWADVGVDPAPEVYIEANAMAGEFQIATFSSLSAAAFPWKQILAADAGAAVGAAITGLPLMLLPGAGEIAWGSRIGGRAIGASLAKLTAVVAGVSTGGPI